MNETTEREVCPICGGDCAGANPPMVFCPMRDGMPEFDEAEFEKAKDKARYGE
jgi:hypothetical protein